MSLTQPSGPWRQTTEHYSSLTDYDCVFRNEDGAMVVFTHAGDLVMVVGGVTLALGTLAALNVSASSLTASRPVRSDASKNLVSGQTDLAASTDVKATGLTTGPVGWNATSGAVENVAGVLNTLTISTTAPLSGGGDLSANRTLAISKADTNTDGYLSKTDWATFNGKAAGSHNHDATYQAKMTPGAHVADASGGTTIDAEARTAVNTVIARLEALGLLASS